MTLFIANSTSGHTANEVLNYGGIGLNNVKRRLDLIYPSAYELNIHRSTALFEVKLSLSLSILQYSPLIQMASI
ncbi:hypothetical protein [Pedobacter hartonius]|uniref:hypothetical protein n=1 Tax=Pedobacter hartonius TaxID=425514 RepID=UPI001C31678F|nr:hypothetical protein [Pedobacter hartonius]